MAERRLYGDAAEIERLLSRMRLIEAAAGGWASVYKETETGVFWLKYYATAAAQGGGYELLIRLPVPATEQLIGIALHTDHEDEAVAAVLRLLDEEKLEKKDFRLYFVERLEQHVQPLPDETTCRRLERLIRLAALDSPMNQREVLHKHQTQIEEDVAFFAEVARRAAAILEKLRQ